MSELITDFRKPIADKTGLIDDAAGMKSDDAGMINEDSGMIDENTGMITRKKAKISEKKPERKKRSRERGSDKKRRKYNPITLRNLKQFQNIPFEQTNASDKWIWIIIGIVIAIIAIIVGWKIYEWWKEKPRNDKAKTLTDN